MTARAAAAAGPLEREAELDRLEDALRAAARGRGGALLVAGPAGIGKTTLLAATRERAGRHGLRPLAARGGELERDFPYGVIRQLLERAVLGADEPERRRLLAGAASLAAPALGLGAARGRGGDAAFAAAHGVYWLCANLAERAPLLLLVDDAHWADEASQRALAYLARRIDELPIALVAAARPAEPGADAAPLADAAGARLDLEPLSLAAVSALLGTRLGGEPDAAFARACHRATGGNPLFLDLLAERLRETGVPPAAAGAPAVEEAGGRAVADAVRRRLAGLPRAPRALAEAVAVLGTDAQLRHAAVLAGLAPEQAADAADALAAAGLLGPGRPLEFVHPVVRTAVHATLAPGRRAADHARAARMLHGEAEPPDRVAVHLLAAEPAADPWAVQTLRAAARGHAARGALEAAVTCFRRALAEPPAAAERPALLADLGSAEARLGGREGIEHLRAAFVEAPPGRERAGIGRRLALSLVPPGRYVEAVEVLEECAETLGGSDRELALTIETEIGIIGRLDPRTRAASAARLARLGPPPAGDTPGERMLLGTLAMEEACRGESADRAAALAERALARGLLADQSADSHGFYDGPYALVVAGRLDAAETAYVAARADARRRGSPLGVARATSFLALVALRRGALADAESEARAAIGAAGPGWVVGRMTGAFLVEALVGRGDLAAAREALRAAGGEDEIPDGFMLNFLLFSRACLRLAEGDLPGGAADLEELGRRELRWRGANPACFPHRSRAARALALLGDDAAAEALAEEEVALARRWGEPRALGIALAALGVVRGDPRHLADAGAALERAGDDLERARALLDLGALLRRRGRRADSRAPLREALDLAHRRGAGGVAERAREELIAAGGRPRRPALRGADALTPSEHRVARLAAGGMTNRRIAEALFVTPRTVEVHLTHVYRKLGVRSRAELPGALAS